MVHDGVYVHIQVWQLGVLVGIITHSGRRATSGHYKAYTTERGMYYQYVTVESHSKTVFSAMQDVLMNVSFINEIENVIYASENDFEEAPFCQ